MTALYGLMLFLLLLAGGFLLRGVSVAAGGRRGPAPELPGLLRQLDRLEQQLRSGEMEEVEYLWRKARVEDALAPFLEVDEGSAPDAGGRETLLPMPWAIFLLGLPLLVVSGYFLSWLELQRVEPRNVAVERSTNVPPAALKMVERLEARLAVAPDDGQGWKRLARSYGVLQRPADALAAYRQAARLLPDDGEILTAYADMLRQSAGQAPPGMGAPSAASPGDAAPDVREMVSRLERKLASNPDNGQGWALLGRSWLALNEPRKALLAYRKAAELLPEDRELARVTALLESSTAEGADQAGEDSSVMVERLTRQAEMKPGDSEAWYRLGLAQRMVGQLPAARDAFQKAYELAPRQEDYLLAFASARMLAEGEATPEVVELVNRALAEHPRSVDALWLAAFVAAEKGQRDQAVAHLKKARELVPATDPRRQRIVSALEEISPADDSAGSPPAPADPAATP